MMDRAGRSGAAAAVGALEVSVLSAGIVVKCAWPSRDRVCGEAVLCGRWRHPGQNHAAAPQSRIHQAAVPAMAGNAR
jgi:hypothetical protein